MTSGLGAWCRGGRQLRCLPGSSLEVGRVPTFLTEMGVWWLQDSSPTHGFGFAELGLDGLWPMLRYRLASSVAAWPVFFCFLSFPGMHFILILCKRLNVSQPRAPSLSRNK